MVEICAHALQATSPEGRRLDDTLGIWGTRSSAAWDRSWFCCPGCVSFWCLSASSNVAETCAHSLQIMSPEGRRLDGIFGVWGIGSFAAWDRL